VIVEALFSYFLLFSIAIANFYNFVLHVFFGKMTAAFIGWEDSLFQLEVGFASLGFAAVGLLAFKGSFDMRSLPSSAGLLSLGCGCRPRLPDDRRAQFRPGNAGAIFYSDMLVPLLGFLFLCCSAAWPRQLKARWRSAEAKNPARHVAFGSSQC
jgi:hypothetical protein